MAEQLTKTADTKELQLIDRCLAGDQSAEFALYKQFAQPLYNMVIRMSGDPAETEDIIQDSFIKVFKKLNTYKREYSFKAWVKRVTINTAITYLRKRKYHFIDVEHESVQDRLTANKPRDFDMNRWIHQAIKELPSGSRVVFNLFAIEGFSHKEIARQMKITESTSKTQYRRARLLLQEKLNPLIHE